MPIEVRQLIIKSTVESADAEPEPRAALRPEALEQLRQDILAECRLLFDEKIQQLRER